MEQTILGSAANWVFPMAPKIMAHDCYYPHPGETGFSLVEVVVATIIFFFFAAGLLATISALSKPAQVSGREIRAAMIAKSVLQDLRKDVDAETWNYGGLTVGGPYNFPIAPFYGGETPTYSASYTVADDPNGSKARKVTVTVTWEE